MGITGSDRSVLDARFGIARFGATRFGVYTPNVVVTVAGTDVSPYVRWGSHRVSLRINDQPDSANFTLTHHTPVVPVVNQPVVVGLGTADNRQFAGQVVRCKHVRLDDMNRTPSYEVECIDWSRLADRRIITTEYAAMSATAIAQDIVTNWTSGFTATNVQADLPTIDYFPLTNESVSRALSRLVSLIGGGGWYWDEYRNLHLFDTGGESGWGTRTAPTTITNGLASLKSFAHEGDSAQQRTRTIVEGPRTTLLIATPAGALSAPLADAAQFEGVASGTSPTIVRIGTEVVVVAADPMSGVEGVIGPALSSAWIAANGPNPPQAVLDADVAAGATNFTLTVGPNFGSGLTFTQWAEIDGQVFFFDSIFTVIPPTWYVFGIPATGYGSLQADLKEKASFRIVDAIRFLDVSPSGALAHAHPAGTDVVARIYHTSGESALASVEGGDGIHEHLISDGRLTAVSTVASLEALADGDLETFDTELLTASWTTDDCNAKPGVLQDINLTVTDPLSATLMITSVELEFLGPNLLPLRHCEASTVRIALPIDTMVQESA